MTESFPPSLSMDRASESINRSIKKALRRRRKENQHFNGVWPAHGRRHLARRVRGARWNNPSEREDITRFARDGAYFAKSTCQLLRSRLAVLPIDERCLES
jgi:hypothetical protein